MEIQIMMAFFGSIGFAIFLKMKGRQILLAGVGGAIAWAVYLAFGQYFDGEFIPNFAAAVFVAVYAEIMARVNRAPTTIFLTAAAIPLIPGGSLYYTMAGLVNRDHLMFSESGQKVITIALAISLGFTLIALINKYIRGISSLRRQ
ncbi:MAG: threonine/serine exporter family protein [Firmicutes bacterium]|nr:threonine/serine exporter family protein [Bacillota bacterium]